MRLPAFLLLAATTTAACGPTVLVEGDVDANSGGAGAASGGSGAASGGDGASSGGSGASSGGTGASSGGTGASSGSSGTASGGPGKPQWAEAFGADGHQHLRALAADLDGNVVVAGDFAGTLDLGSGPLEQKGLRSAFVIKLDSKGQVLWSRTLTADDCAAAALAVNAANEVLVTGFVKGSLHVGDKPVPGDGIFVAKLGAAHGDTLWAHTYGSSAAMQADRGLSIAVVPPSGAALVSGSFVGALDLGGPVTGSGGVFVAALDDGGVPMWATALPGSRGVAAAGPKGHAVVGTSTDGAGLAVFDLDETGVTTWTKSFQPGSFSAVVVDAAGNAVLAGSTTTADFGGGPLSSPLPNGEGFVVSFDAAGQHRYTRGLPFDSTQSSAVALTVDGASGVAVTGSYVHHADGGSSVVQSAFLSTFDASGKPLATRTFGPIDGFGGSVTQEGWGVAPAPGGGLYLGGDFYTAIDVAGASLTGSGSADLFVARLAP
jgi:hypothetical protein